MIIKSSNDPAGLGNHTEEMNGFHWFVYSSIQYIELFVCISFLLYQKLNSSNSKTNFAFLDD